MDYNLAGMCADQSFDLDKKLKAINEKFIKQYIFALNIINNTSANEHRSEIIQAAEDVLRDATHKAQIFYIEALNKVERVLSQHL